ncbi:uncharacterized protein LOC135922378 isoform X1 [Gordionus sp. m RMFG-2023]|uniref:uncharacterized protein LOC135922378 isoform X1 n=1 Tax=Gordionus sp. m RMFG-2023 TaxID=3053472 RepID=UPI0031FDB6E5
MLTIFSHKIGLTQFLSHILSIIEIGDLNKDEIFNQINVYHLNTKNNNTQYLQKNLLPYNTEVNEIYSNIEVFISHIIKLCKDGDLLNFLPKPIIYIIVQIFYTFNHFYPKDTYNTILTNSSIGISNKMSAIMINNVISEILIDYLFKDIVVCPDKYGLFLSLNIINIMEEQRKFLIMLFHIIKEALTSPTKSENIDAPNTFDKIPIALIAFQILENISKNPGQGVYDPNFGRRSVEDFEKFFFGRDVVNECNRATNKHEPTEFLETEEILLNFKELYEFISFCKFATGYLGNEDEDIIKVLLELLDTLPPMELPQFFLIDTNVTSNKEPIASPAVSNGSGSPFTIGGVNMVNVATLADRFKNLNSPLSLKKRRASPALNLTSPLPIGRSNHSILSDMYTSLKSSAQLTPIKSFDSSSDPNKVDSNGYSYATTGSKDELDSRTNGSGLPFLDMLVLPWPKINKDCDRMTDKGKVSLCRADDILLGEKEFYQRLEDSQFRALYFPESETHSASRASSSSISKDFNLESRVDTATVHTKQPYSFAAHSTSSLYSNNIVLKHTRFSLGSSICDNLIDDSMFSKLYNKFSPADTNGTTSVSHRDVVAGFRLNSPSNIFAPPTVVDLLTDTRVSGPAIDQSSSVLPVDSLVLISPVFFGPGGNPEDAGLTNIARASTYSEGAGSLVVETVDDVSENDAELPPDGTDLRGHDEVIEGSDDDGDDVNDDVDDDVERELMMIHAAEDNSVFGGVSTVGTPPLMISGRDTPQSQSLTSSSPSNDVENGKRPGPHVTSEICDDAMINGRDLSNVDMGGGDSDPKIKGSTSNESQNLSSKYSIIRIDGNFEHMKARHRMLQQNQQNDRRDASTLRPARVSLYPSNNDGVTVHSREVIRNGDNVIANDRNHHVNNMMLVNGGSITSLGSSYSSATNRHDSLIYSASQFNGPPSSKSPYFECDENISLVSETWSTDVLASDSETATAYPVTLTNNQILSHSHLAAGKSLGFIPHTSLAPPITSKFVTAVNCGISESMTNSTTGNNVLSDIGDAGSESAWSTEAHAPSEIGDRRDINVLDKLFPLSSSGSYSIHATPSPFFGDVIVEEQRDETPEPVSGQQDQITPKCLSELSTNKSELRMKPSNSTASLAAIIETFDPLARGASTSQGSTKIEKLNSETMVQGTPPRFLTTSIVSNEKGDGNANTARPNNFKLNRLIGNGFKIGAGSIFKSPSFESPMSKVQNFLNSKNSGSSSNSDTPTTQPCLPDKGNHFAQPDSVIPDLNSQDQRGEFNEVMITENGCVNISRCDSPIQLARTSLMKGFQNLKNRMMIPGSLMNDTPKVSVLQQQPPSCTNSESSIISAPLPFLETFHMDDLRMGPSKPVTIISRNCLDSISSSTYAIAGRETMHYVVGHDFLTSASRRVPSPSPPPSTCSALANSSVADPREDVTTNDEENNVVTHNDRRNLNARDNGDNLDSRVRHNLNISNKGDNLNDDSCNVKHDSCNVKHEIDKRRILDDDISFLCDYLIKKMSISGLLNESRHSGSLAVRPNSVQKVGSDHPDDENSTNLLSLIRLVQRQVDRCHLMGDFHNATIWRHVLDIFGNNYGQRNNRMDRLITHLSTIFSLKRAYKNYLRLFAERKNLEYSILEDENLDLIRRRNLSENFMISQVTQKFIRRHAQSIEIFAQEFAKLATPDEKSDFINDFQLKLRRQLVHFFPTLRSSPSKHRYSPPKNGRSFCTTHSYPLVTSDDFGLSLMSGYSEDVCRLARDCYGPLLYNSAGSDNDFQFSHSSQFNFHHCPVCSFSLDKPAHHRSSALSSYNGNNQNEISGDSYGWEGIVWPHVRRHLYSRVFRSAMFPNGDGDFTRDQLFARHIAKITALGLDPRHKDLNIPERNLAFYPWTEARNALKALNLCSCPREKLFHVIRTCLLVSAALSHSGFASLSAGDHSAAQADDLVPVLVYVVLAVNPRALLSNVQYVEQFYFKRSHHSHHGTSSVNSDGRMHEFPTVSTADDFSSCTGEIGYLWTQFRSVVEFIKTMEYADE